MSGDPTPVPSPGDSKREPHNCEPGPDAVVGGDPWIRFFCRICRREMTNDSLMAEQSHLRHHVIIEALKSARVGEGRTDYERALMCGRVAEAVERALERADWWADPDNGIPTPPVRRPPLRKRWLAGVAAVAKNEWLRERQAGEDDR